jgi:hypothetical protein
MHPFKCIAYSVAFRYGYAFAAYFRSFYGPQCPPMIPGQRRAFQQGGSSWLIRGSSRLASLTALSVRRDRSGNLAIFCLQVVIPLDASKHGFRPAMFVRRPFLNHIATVFSRQAQNL